MKRRAIKPLALLGSVIALGLGATQPVLAAEAQYQVGHTFSDSLDTTVRPCTNSRCDIGGGFDRLSNTDYPHDLPRLSGASNNPGSGGGWDSQQETIILIDARANNTPPNDGGGWANQQETIRLSAAQPSGGSGSGGGWANQQDTLPDTDKDYGESLDYSPVLAGGPIREDSCTVCQPKRAITLDELNTSVSDGGWAGQPVEQSWLESNALSRAVRPCTNNQCSDDLPA